MCLIVFKPKEATLDERILRSAHLRNNDGFGIMYAHEGRVKSIKSQGTFDDFLGIYNPLKDIFDLGIHFRMRTHGEISEAMCHPYRVLKKSKHGVDLWLMHNGILSTGTYDKNGRFSDTFLYIQQNLRPVLAANPSLRHNQAFLDMVCRDIGTGNKLLTLDGDGKFMRFNYQAGKMVGDCWLSNTYAWVDPTVTPYVPNGYWDYKRRQFVDYNPDQEDFSDYQDYSGYGYRSIPADPTPVTPPAAVVPVSTPTLVVERVTEQAYDRLRGMDFTSKEYLTDVMHVLPNLSYEDLLDFVQDEPDVAVEILMELSWLATKQ